MFGNANGGNNNNWGSDWGNWGSSNPVGGSTVTTTSTGWGAPVGGVATMTGLQVMKIINDKIVQLKNTQYTGIEMMKLLRDLEGKELLRVVGKGTNRAVIELLVQHFDVKRSVKFNDNTPVIIKVPIQIASAAIANHRESLVISVLESFANRGDQEANSLISVLPFARTLPNTDLLIEEKVVPIEYSTEVINMASRQGIKINKMAGETTREDPDYETSIGIGSICRDFLSNGKPYQQLRELLTRMSKYFVLADVNPEFTPFNYGIKNINGGGHITLLDMGAVLPKNGYEVKCPNCGRPLKQIFPWTEGITPAEKHRLKEKGIYTCGNNNCSSTGPTIIRDTDVLMRQRDILIQEIYNSGKNWDLLDKI